MPALSYLSFLLLTVLPLAAQDVDIPSQTPSSGGDSALVLPGIGKPGRIQVIIDDSQARLLAGKRIVGVSLRRSTGGRDALLGGSVRLKLRVGRALVAPAEALSEFGSNMAGATVVFDGSVRVPNSPAPSGPVDWTINNTVRIDFSSPYNYSVGGLALEFEGDAAGVFLDWPIDAQRDPAAGSLLRVGAGCGAAWRQLRTTFQLSESDLVPGTALRVFGHGHIGATATLMFGLSMRSSPVDLAIVGAPGCLVYVDPLATLASPVRVSQFGQQVPGEAVQVVNVPNSIGLLDAYLAMQWLYLGQDVTVSEAAACVLSSTPRTLGASIVEGVAASSSGHLYSDVAPVIRFHVQ